MNKWLLIILAAFLSPILLPAFVVGLLIAAIEEAIVCFRASNHQ